MGQNTGDPVAGVREEPGKTPKESATRMTRLKLRIDYHEDTGRLDWSMVSWHHPEARMIRNEVVEDLGPLLHDVAYVDICSILSELFDRVADHDGGELALEHSGGELPHAAGGPGDPSATADAALPGGTAQPKS